MRVAYVLPAMGGFAGWRTYASALISALRENIEPVLFSASEDREAVEELFPDASLYVLPATQRATLEGRRGPLLLAQTYAAIRSGKFPKVDLVHSLEAYPTGMVGVLLARRLRCPHILTAHGSYAILPYAHPLNRRAYWRVLQGTQLVCPVSPGTGKLMQEYFGPALANTEIQPILNGSDFYKRIPRECAMERQLPSIPTLLTVGEVKPRKGQMVSVRAFAQVKEHLPEARYWIAGRLRPDYHQEILAFLRAAGVEGVEFLGIVSDEELERLYREASIFVMTAQQVGLRFEGFGMVYLEAGAYGLPVVAADSGGVSAAVRDGETGFLVPEADPTATANAILRLLTDPELALGMGRANREWAETLTWERAADELLEAYQYLLERERA